MSLGLNFRDLTVLVIDDMESMRVILHSILKSLGVGRVLEVESAERGLEILKAKPVDIVISDMRLEGMQGCEFVQTVRSGEDGLDPFLPIVMISAHTEKERILLARDSGISEFLAKPISAKQVYQRLQSIVETPRPFIKVKNFFGPDRRRKQLNVKVDDRRASEHDYDYCKPGAQRIPSW